MRGVVLGDEDGMDGEVEGEAREIPGQGDGAEVAGFCWTKVGSF